MPLLSLPDLHLTLEPGGAARATGPGAPRLWARLAETPASTEEALPIHYKGEDIARWTPARRRAAGLLALFARPRAPDGLTLPQLLRASCGVNPPRGLRRTLRERAALLGVPEDLLDAPLADARWAPFGAAAEWLQAAVLEPALVVSAAPADAGALAASAALRAQGAAIVFAGGGAAPDDAVLLELP